MDSQLLMLGSIVTVTIPSHSSPSHLSELRCLFLQCNRIARIENLCSLSNLTTLNLSGNCLEKLENLEKLTSLHTLMVADNKLKEADRCGNKAGNT